MKEINNIYIAIALAISGIIIFIFYDAIPALGNISIAQALIAGAVGGSLTALLSYFGIIKKNTSKNKSDKNT